MQTKANRFTACILALFMLLMAVTITPLSVNVSAEGEAVSGNTKTYVLDANNLDPLAKLAEGETKTIKEDYFTIYLGGKSEINETKKSFSDLNDDYKATQRINFGGKSDFSKPLNAVEITTEGPATVTIWWACANTSERQVQIWDCDNDKPAYTTSYECVKDQLHISTADLSKAGKYYIGNTGNKNYFYKIEVTVTLPKSYVLDANDLTVGDYKGKTVEAGTENIFKVVFNSKMGKVEERKAGFEDDYTATKAINFDGKTDISKSPLTSYIGFTTTKDTVTVKVWWECGGDGREVTIYDLKNSKEVFKTKDSAKGETYISEYVLTGAGEYAICGFEGKNYYYKVEVTEGAPATPETKDWDDIENPTIDSIEYKDGKINVTVTADVTGNDKVTVTMRDKDGNETLEESTARKQTHILKFAVSASGKYTFKAVLSREGEKAKESAESKFDFVLPLGTPSISSATNIGGLKIQVEWSPVAEATSYNVYRDGTYVGSPDTTTTTSYTDSGLTKDQEYTYTVSAVRDEEEGKQSAPFAVKAVEEAQQKWSYVFFGPSTNSEKNGYEGNLNEDGDITVYSEGGKGKITNSGADGLSVYYTTVPSNMNFRLRATVHIDSWSFSNGQDGFGLIALDSVPEISSSADNLTNFYMAAATKMEYRYNSEETNNIYDGVVYDGTGVKYSMQIGLGVNSKLGYTKDNVTSADTTFVQFNQYPLDLCLVNGGYDPSSSWNTIANCTSKELNSIRAEDLREEFILEIERNNTGYFVSYYTADGKWMRTQKFYDTEALDKLDEENVYVGFFAARNARATFSNVEFETVKPENDDSPEERPIEKVNVLPTVFSATVANDSAYDLLIKSNVDGEMDVYLNNVMAAEKVAVTRDTLVTVPLTINVGTNSVKVIFTPDPDQVLGESKVLASTDPVEISFNVKYDNGYSGFNFLYVAPDGDPDALGLIDAPMDIYTAVSVAKPGQTIVLKEGTYKVTDASKPITIQRGMDGIADKPISMIADPEAKSRPVLDFDHKTTGLTAGGDYWYFKGFDVTNSIDGKGGFHVCGSHIILDSINAYNNGDTGIYIHALRNSSDPRELWPHDNLILNCTSHHNVDIGYEDADGFACKLTTGANNVFDGCVAYYNADDGWDFYAKTSTGAIDAVTIRNCVAYRNGYLDDGKNSKAGNGNGFKMGGEGLPAGHVIINSIAFDNRAKGIDSNSCPDIKVYNCTSYNNGSYNVALYTKKENANYAADGIISFKDGNAVTGLEEGDNYDMKGQDMTKIISENVYIWNGTRSANSKDEEVTADMFVSLEFKGVARNDDGTINMQGFLELNEKAPEKAGARMSGMPSYDVTVVPDVIPVVQPSTSSQDTSSTTVTEPEPATSSDQGGNTSEPATSSDATPEVTNVTAYPDSSSSDSSGSDNPITGVGVASLIVVTSVSGIAMIAARKRKNK